MVPVDTQVPQGHPKPARRKSEPSRQIHCSPNWCEAMSYSSAFLYCLLTQYVLKPLLVLGSPSVKDVLW